MPRTRFKAWIEAPDQASLDALKNVVKDAVPPPNKVFDKPHHWSSDTDADGVITVVLDLRTKVKVDGDGMYDGLVALKAQMAATGCTGRISVHDCSHDDPVVVSCTDPAGNWREDTF